MSSSGSREGWVAGQRRLDIDLLRAVAVLQVILFHLGVPGTAGGFVGVDVFFVISGFLISGKTEAEIDRREFSYLTFLGRRARRLVPAFAVTLLCTGIAGVWLLTAEAHASLQRELVYSSAYLSNFLFWMQSGYFDTEALSKPLLHTWSLAVEEQFYLFWPLFLLLVPGRRRLRFYLLAGMLSLAACEVALAAGAGSAAFFLFPFRVMEFAIGASVPWWRLPSNRRVLGVLQLLAVASLAAPTVLLDDRSHFPGLGALPICLGTAALIALQPGWLNVHNPLTRVGSWIGKVSYSAYLVHWPLVVFYSQAYGEVSGFGRTGLMLGVILLASGLMWQFVERPFLRSRWSVRAFLPAVPLTVVLFLALTAVAPRVYDRVHADRADLDALLAAVEPREEMQQRLLDAEILSERQGEVRVAVLGDSHSIDGGLALQMATRGWLVVEIVHTICDPLVQPLTEVEIEQLYAHHTNRAVTPERCGKEHPQLLPWIQRLDPQVILFSENWRTEALPYLDQTLEILGRETSARIVVLGLNQTFNQVPGQLLKNLSSVWQVNQEAWNQRVDNSVLDAELQRAAARQGAAFISKSDLVCPQQGVCDYLHSGALTYWDRTHWTEPGLAVFGDRLLARLQSLSVLEPRPPSSR